MTNECKGFHKSSLWCVSTGNGLKRKDITWEKGKEGKWRRNKSLGGVREPPKPKTMFHATGTARMNSPMECQRRCLVRYFSPCGIGSEIIHKVGSKTRSGRRNPSLRSNPEEGTEKEEPTGGVLFFKKNSGGVEHGLQIWATCGQSNGLQKWRWRGCMRRQEIQVMGGFYLDIVDFCLREA